MFFDGGFRGRAAVFECDRGGEGPFDVAGSRGKGDVIEVEYLLPLTCGISQREGIYIPEDLVRILAVLTN